MKNPAITAAFAKTYELANKLAITGTPSYVVGNEVVFGALGQEVLSEKIAAARPPAHSTPAELELLPRHRTAKARCLWTAK